MFGVIKVTIDKTLKSKGVTMYRLSKDTGIAYSTLWKLKSKQVRSIDLEVLEKVCGYLKITPNDLLEIIPEK